MNPIIRNFWSIFRRFRLAMTLNVLGMALAFAAFLAIMMQWQYDVMFNASIPNRDRIFRVESDFGDQGISAMTARPIADLLIQSSPHIEAGVQMLMSAMDVSLTMDDVAGNHHTYNESYRAVTPGFVDVFQLEMVEGKADVLEVGNQVLIPQSLARKWFGTESALGRSFTTGEWCQYTDATTFTIAGVYRDFPQNSSLDNVIYVSCGDFMKDNWNEINHTTYLLLDDPSSVSSVLADYRVAAEKADINPDEPYIGKLATLDAFSDLHFLQGVEFDTVPKANRQTVYLLFTIAWVVLLVAAVNFTNFSMALAPVRMRSINTQRVLGSTVAELRRSLTLESIVFAVGAYLISLILLYAARSAGLEQLMTATLSFRTHWGMLVAVAILSLLLGAVAGLYPACYMTSFTPVMALKGSFGLSPAGRRLRTVLMGFQFVASFTLIIAMLFLLLQSRYTRTAPFGYEKDHLLVVNLSTKLTEETTLLKQRLETISGVEGIAYADRLLQAGDMFSTWGRKYHGRAINFHVMPVSPDFLRVLGVHVVEGRDFLPSDEQGNGVVIFNETARERLDLQVGEMASELQIVGFVPDVKYLSLRKAVAPMAFLVPSAKFSATSYAYVRASTETDLYTLRTKMEKVLHELDPDGTSEVAFFDEILEQTYESERHLTTLIALFSFLAVFISIVGVFGLVVFDSEYKRKEIGIRKVMGATTGEILVMFNKVYLRMMSVCFILAAPLSWYGVHRWLENFSYKTPMYWWVYLAALAVVGLITVATVTYQNWKAANANPVESLKTE